MTKRQAGRIRKRLGEAGQSTVEFAMTLLLLMSFVLFFTQLSLCFAVGNYVHYATFMAARALLSGTQNAEDQTTHARDVIVRMLKKSAGQAGVDRWPSIAKGTGGSDPGGYQPGSSNFQKTRDLSWLQGVRYTFRSRLFMIPLGRASAAPNGSVNSVTLTSESWLGRDPADDNCRAEMGKLLAIFDNGC